VPQCAKVNEMHGVFSSDSTGAGQAAALNQDGLTLNTVNTVANPAKIGDTISVYATGEGQTTPTGVDGKPRCRSAASTESAGNRDYRRPDG
jgi:uncharacterized protein (TIGR03437 family)